MGGLVAAVTTGLLILIDAMTLDYINAANVGDDLCDVAAGGSRFGRYFDRRHRGGGQFVACGAAFDARGNPGSQSARLCACALL